MSGNHTVKSYDADLKQIDSVVINIMVKTKEQISNAVRAMAEGDQALAGAVKYADKEINALEKELQELCVRTLALREPKGRDLRKVVSATRIGVDIERVADYAVNVAKRVPAMNSSLPREVISQVISMGRSAQEMLSELTKAYESNDSRLAIEVWRMDDKIDDLFADILTQTLPNMEITDQGRRLELHTLALFVVKAVERMGDHLTNVAEQIYYSIEGVGLYTAVDKENSD